MLKKILMFVFGFLAKHFWQKSEKLEEEIEQRKEVSELERRLSDSLKMTIPLPQVDKDGNIAGRSKEDVFDNSDWNS